MFSNKNCQILSLRTLIFKFPVLRGPFLKKNAAPTASTILVSFQKPRSAESSCLLHLPSASFPGQLLKPEWKKMLDTWRYVCVCIYMFIMINIYIYICMISIYRDAGIINANEW